MLVRKKIYLSKDLHYKTKTNKSLIVLADTKRSGLNHIKYSKRLRKRDIPHFTIMKNGYIFQHMDVENYNENIKDKNISKKSIIIELENLSWLSYNVYENTYYNWTDIEKSNLDEIVEKEWRYKIYWNKYTDEQHNSLLKLLHFLCKEYKIPKKLINHNNIVEDLESFNGIIYKNNISKHYYGLNPSFNYKKFYKEFKELK